MLKLGKAHKDSNDIDSTNIMILCKPFEIDRWINFANKLSVNGYKVIIAHREKVVSKVNNKNIKVLDSVIDFKFIEHLNLISIFIISDQIEFCKNVNYPKNSKVVVFSHSGIDLALKRETNIFNHSLYFECADYYFSPLRYEKLKMNNTDFWQYLLPKSILRGSNNNLTLIPGGYIKYDLAKKEDSNFNKLKNSIVICPTNCNYKFKSKWLNIIFKVCDDFKEFKIVLRPHPEDPYFQEICNELKSRISNLEVDVEKSDINSFKNAFLIISDFSGVSYTASTRYRIPNIQLILTEIELKYANDLPGFDIGIKNDYQQYEFGYILSNLNEINNIIKTIIKEQFYWYLNISLNLKSLISNFGNATSYFISCIPLILKGSTNKNWITIQKSNTESPEKDLYIESQRKLIRKNISVYEALDIGLKGIMIFKDDEEIQNQFLNSLGAYISSSDIGLSRKAAFIKILIYIHKYSDPTINFKEQNNGYEKYLEKIKTSRTMLYSANHSKMNLNELLESSFMHSNFYFLYKYIRKNI